MTASKQAPRRVVDREFGSWVAREPSGADEEAMAPGHAARMARLERQIEEQPDPVERLRLPVGTWT